MVSFMFKIIVESDNPKEPAVQWVLDTLKYKNVRHTVSADRRNGVHVTVLEKKV